MTWCPSSHSSPMEEPDLSSTGFLPPNLVILPVCPAVSTSCIHSICLFLSIFIYLAVSALNCSTWTPAVARGVRSHSTRAQVLCGLWDPSSWTRAQTRIPCTAKQNLNHQTTREVPRYVFIECLLPWTLMMQWGNTGWSGKEGTILSCPSWHLSSCLDSLERSKASESRQCGIKQLFTNEKGGA